MCANRPAILVIHGGAWRTGDKAWGEQIAEELCVHYRTVENHRTNISSKLGLRGSHALIKFALKHKAEL